MQITIDFDGTVVTHDFPNVGKDIGAVPILKKLINNGHQLILNTMRSHGMRDYGDKPLDDAVNWFKENNIPLYGININPEQWSWTKSPKAYGHYDIDDTNAFAPLIYDRNFHDRPYIDWKTMEVELIRIGLI